MQVKLTNYRVTNFKSVIDSGWIDCQNVTTLVGVNEAGKSNLLLALWKLKPAHGGKIDILHDMPTSLLSELRSKEDTTPFISARFSLDGEDISEVFSDPHCFIENLSEIVVTRFYDGHYECRLNEEASIQIEEEAVEETDEDTTGNQVCSKRMPMREDDVRAAIVDALPSFVYYSNYGNLSSRVYLPNATTWLSGGSIPGINQKEDQIRTLRVLFDFVNLSPKEIQELGRNPSEFARSRGSSSPTEEELEKAAKDKEQRTILLNSASNKLTKEFKEWWKQGSYIFRLQADGDYFSIWVSDEKRPAEVDLEDRSTGLQWFLSFFLVFLVEAQGDNEGAILLLDEAGLSLHPKAQRDLIAFFDELAKSNQIVYTTHSPFLVDTDNVDRCVAVYVDKAGNTVASNNLRDGAGSLEENSVYAVHAALGLSISDVLLLGCQPVIVEGPSDQYVLGAIKQKLISEGKIKPVHELVFLPAGGNKGITAIAGVLGMRDGLPPVILDADRPGIASAKHLKAGMYKQAEEKVITLADVLQNVNEPEVEDLIPFTFMERYLNKLFASIDDVTFGDDYDQKKPIVPQIEQFASCHGVELPRGKWKVNLAKNFKTQLNRNENII